MGKGKQQWSCNFNEESLPYLGWKLFTWFTQHICNPAASDTGQFYGDISVIGPQCRILCERFSQLLASSEKLKRDAEINKWIQVFRQNH